MGRPEQRKRDQKRAAASCQKLEKFFAINKKTKLDEHDHATEENKPSASSLPEISIVSSNQSDNESDRMQLLDSSTDNDVCSSHQINKITDEPLSDMIPCNGIGLLINETMTVSEIETVLTGLKDNEKYNLLKNHFISDSTHNFPIV